MKKRLFILAPAIALGACLDVPADTPNAASNVQADPIPKGSSNPAADLPVGYPRPYKNTGTEYEVYHLYDVPTWQWETDNLTNIEGVLAIAEQSGHVRDIKCLFPPSSMPGTIEADLSNGTEPTGFGEIPAGIQVARVAVLGSISKHTYRCLVTATGPDIRTRHSARDQTGNGYTTSWRPTDSNQYREIYHGVTNIEYVSHWPSDDRNALARMTILAGNGPVEIDVVCEFAPNRVAFSWFDHDEWQSFVIGAYDIPGVEGREYCDIAFDLMDDP